MLRFCPEKLYFLTNHGYLNPLFFGGFFCFFLTDCECKGGSKIMVQSDSFIMKTYCICNLGQNICILFSRFSKISLQHKWNYHYISITRKWMHKSPSRATERLKTQDLRKLGNFQKITQLAAQKPNFDAFQ